MSAWDRQEESLKRTRWSVDSTAVNVLQTRIEEGVCDQMNEFARF